MKSSFHLATGFVALALCYSLVVGVASAQTARSGGGANAQLMQQMQQLASERTSLQAENAKLKKELDDLRKERDSLKSGQKAVAARMQSGAAELKQAEAQRESLQEEIRLNKEKTGELVGKFRETLQTLRDVETDRTATQQKLAERDQSLKTCVDHNTELYKIDDEVLTHLEKQGLFTRVAASEPFTRLKRNQLENYADEYRARANDQKLPASSLPASSPPASMPQTNSPPVSSPPTGSAPVSPMTTNPPAASPPPTAAPVQVPQP